MPKHTVDTSEPKTPELLALLPARKPLPGEDAAQLADLKHALMLQLAPSTPLEHFLADDIFNLLRDAIAHRSYRDALLRAGTRQLSQGVFHKGKIGKLGFGEKNEQAEQLGFDLVGDDTAQRQKALALLKARKVTIDEVIARAYAAGAEQISTHEAQIAEIETRRRKLLEDYARLKAAAARPVEDAVLVEDA